MAQKAASAIRPQTASRPKYGNVRGEIDGHRFDSMAEGRRYLYLRDRQERGEIRDLEPHPPAYRFEHEGVLVGTYTPDFRYVVIATDELVVEDVKSGPTRTKDYKLRKNMMLAFHGIAVVEVGR